MGPKTLFYSARLGLPETSTVTKYETAERMQQKWEGGGKDGAGGRGGGRGQKQWGLGGGRERAQKQQEKSGGRGGRVEKKQVKSRGGLAGGWEMNAKNGFVPNFQPAGQD